MLLFLVRSHLIDDHVNLVVVEGRFGLDELCECGPIVDDGGLLMGSEEWQECLHEGI